MSTQDEDNLEENFLANNTSNTHAIKQRLLKMEEETKKIAQMQRKSENIINSHINNNDSNNDDNNIEISLEDDMENENEEIVEIYSASTSPIDNYNNINDLNDDPTTPNTNKSKTKNISPHIVKTNEINNEANNNNNDIQYPSADDQKLLDERSIFINNLHHDITAPDLRQLFATCGTIERITIVCDKWTGKPKGCSYIQFKSRESVDNAMILNGSEVKGKAITVQPKRTNLPKWLRGRGRGSGRAGMFGRGRGYPVYFPPFAPPMMSGPYGYYRGRGYRGRGYWQPY